MRAKGLPLIMSLDHAIFFLLLTSTVYSSAPACPDSCSCLASTLECLGKSLNEDSVQRVFQTLPEGISNIDLSRNAIKHLDLTLLHQMKVARIAENKISTISGSATPSILISLDLTHNEISTLHDPQLFRSCDQLAYLNVSWNRIKNITSGLNSLVHVTTLDVSNNQLSLIYPSAFDNLKHLTKLDLSHNRIGRLRHEWFLFLFHLEKLDLSFNQISQLNNLVFSKLESLKKLNLRNNQIETIGKLAFKGLKNLDTLVLSGNRIRMLPAGGFKTLLTIRTIDISNNPLETLNDAFSGIRASNWTLQANYITKLRFISADSFVGLEKLKRLEICNGTALSHIEKGTFNKLSELETLDLSGNNLTTLRTGIFFPLHSLRTLVLVNNPWHCDCRMYWIISWLSDKHDVHLAEPQNTFCYLPMDIEHRTLLDGLDVSITCQNATITNFTRNAHYRLLTDARLHCDYTGIPTPNLTWITPYGQELKVPQIIESTMSTSATKELTVADNETLPRIRLDGNDLLVQTVQRGDSGYYQCVVSNVLNSQTAFIHLTLDYDFLVNIQIMSIVCGLACCIIFILLTGVGLLTERILEHFGLKCPCDADGPIRRRNVYQILESIENYKGQQLERLRDNYTAQVQRIKDNCTQQMDRIKDSYYGQTEKVRTYGSSQLGYIRENYCSQVQRVRDYGNTQMDWVRENYVFQRNRIRKFSTHQLIRLRENYKIQQKHLNKILENLPNLESCGRNACGGSTDSVLSVLPPILIPPPPPLDAILEFPDPDEFSLPDIAERMDDEMSAYFTPEAVSLRSSRSSLNRPPRVYQPIEDVIRSRLVIPVPLDSEHQPSTSSGNYFESTKYLAPVREPEEEESFIELDTLQEKC